jgi:hypothetical protein
MEEAQRFCSVPAVSPKGGLFLVKTIATRSNGRLINHRRFFSSSPKKVLGVINDHSKLIPKMKSISRESH